MDTTGERIVRELTRMAHMGLDFPALADRAWTILRHRFGADGACWLSLDPATMLPTGHVAQNSVGAAYFPSMSRNEFLEDDVCKFVVLYRSDCPSAGLRLVTSGEPERSRRYREILSPNGITDELRLVLTSGSLCWGALVLYRRGDNAPFTREEVGRAAMLSEVLGDGLRRSVLLRRVEEEMEAPAPGVIVLNERNRVEAMTPAADYWLGQIVDEGLEAEGIPVTLYSIATRARAVVGDPQEAARPAQVRVPMRNGQWALMHGAVLGDSAEGRVAIVIDPAPAPDIAPLIAEAYGLTRRENELAVLVLRGLSTAEIAGCLHISSYTVQDHLKSIFQKIGVSSRGELAATLFFNHYVPQLTNLFETPSGSRVTWTPFRPSPDAPLSVSDARGAASRGRRPSALALPEGADGR